jgi:hypothetical protein
VVVSVNAAISKKYPLLVFAFTWIPIPPEDPPTVILLSGDGDAVDPVVGVSKYVVLPTGAWPTTGLF